MLYAVTLHYRRPKADIEAHLDAHRDWLATHVRTGLILAAGPLDSGAGGLLLAHAPDRATLDAMLASDAFVIHDLVECEVRGFTPALRCADFPVHWAPDAKAVTAAARHPA